MTGICAKQTGVGLDRPLMRSLVFPGRVCFRRTSAIRERRAEVRFPTVQKAFLVPGSSYADRLAPRYPSRTLAGQNCPRSRGPGSLQPSMWSCQHTAWRLLRSWPGCSRSPLGLPTTTYRSAAFPRCQRSDLYLPVALDRPQRPWRWRYLAPGAAGGPRNPCAPPPRLGKFQLHSCVLPSAGDRCCSTSPLGAQASLAIGSRPLAKRGGLACANTRKSSEHSA